MAEDDSGPDRKAARMGRWLEHIRTHLLERLRKTSVCFRAEDLETGDIHRARRLLKEATALVLLLDRVVGAEARELSHGLREMRRSLGSLRDVDVLVLTLQECAALLPEASLASLQATLAARRAELHAASVRPDTAVLRKDLSRMARDVRRWSLRDATRADLLAPIRDAYRTTRRRGLAGIADGDHATLHNARKSLILARYQVEVLEDAWPKLLRAWCAEAQNLRDLLGHHQDLTVLEGFLRQQAAGIDIGPALTGLQTRMDAIVAEAHDVFARVCADRPAAFERRLDALLAAPRKLPRGRKASAKKAVAATAKPATAMQPVTRVATQRRKPVAPVRAPLPTEPA